MNAARLPARIGHKQPLAGASPSPTETVRGVLINEEEKENLLGPRVEIEVGKLTGPWK